MGGSSARVAVAVAALGLCLGASGCTSTRWRASFAPPAAAGALDRGAPYLKAHLADGGVVVLRDWSVDDARHVVRGEGLRYDPHRRIRDQGALEVPLADVVLFETNEPEAVRDDNLVVLGVVSGASLAMTAVCLLNPKACFGSCPTFYVQGEHGWSLRAEGFSSSIARVLEATDVDALGVVDPPAGRFDVQMTNEALETHVVRWVRVLSAPRPEGVRVLRGAEGLRIARELAAPVSCAASEGDCLDALSTADGRERTSPADPEDLAARESIELAFRHPAGPAGVALVARNSLLNTFVFYQLLAYMGRDVGTWVAALETMGPVQLGGFQRIGALLADVDVEVLTERGWQRAGSYSEVGPIARETQLVVLPDDLPAGDVRVRLGLGKGSWRLDGVALATLGAAVEPVVLEPVRATRLDGSDAPDVLAALRDPERTVVHYPGDGVTLSYDLPAGPQELFLESRGYYYEWMRREWLRERNPIAALRGLADPEGLLRRLAPAYKRIEPYMDRIFWSTRIGRAAP